MERKIYMEALVGLLLVLHSQSIHVTKLGDGNNGGN